ncbi:hypothetical protein OG394_35605 [Kribbella sp. NBC_01245]|uniref:hypothetical protein n=1 Tax=Kribbella sp. NBC_01245 TaxID=2903578 RepID=UPI002E2C93FD|nr:hypothetical protein [Kribbella sp. NBC_01245]
MLPGSSTCAVILTSRSVLTSIPGAEQLQLDVPPVDESLDLLAQLSRRPLTTDPAWSDVVTYCGGLPLAIRIAGARLASRPQWPVSHLAERLADVHRRLDGLELGHLGVRASLGLSIDQLAESDNALDVLAAKAFALLGLLELPELTARQVGSTIATGFMDPTREAWLDPAWYHQAADLTTEEDVHEWLDAEPLAITSTIRQILTGPESERYFAIRIVVGVNGHCVRRRLWIDWASLTSMTIELAPIGTDQRAASLLWHDLSAALGDHGYTQTEELEKLPTSI